jgi:hypothetical protein
MKANNDSTPEELKIAAEYFLRIATKHGALVTGFAFGADPAFLMKFGTVSDEGEELERLHKMLCQMVRNKVKEGKVVTHDVVSGVN